MLERSYRWDEAGQLAELHDLSAGLRRYEYDACARLVGVEGDLPERFGWSGNMLLAESATADAQ